MNIRGVFVKIKKIQIIIIPTFFLSFILISQSVFSKSNQNDLTDLPITENLFINLSKKVDPSVVNISADPSQKASMGKGSQNNQQDAILDLFEHFFGHQPNSRFERPKRDTSKRPIGTGFLISSDGLIITNNHVVDAGVPIKVALPSAPEKYYDVKILGRDVRGDIALIKINAKHKLPYLELGTSKNLQKGQWVAAFGNPFGHLNTLTKGIVSALDRHITPINKYPFIQTDASINPGNSGGPLVNTRGKVIGVNTAVLNGAQGIGFAIPIDYVKSVLPMMKKGKSIQRGFLGLAPVTLSPRIATGLGISTDTRGVLVTQVFANSSASAAGLREYDIITKFNKNKITTEQELIRATQDTVPGSKIKLEILRPTKKSKLIKKTLTATLMPHPQDAENEIAQNKLNAPSISQTKSKLGFYARNSSRDSYSGNKKHLGPIVSKVVPNSPAHKAGLSVGDIIIDVNKHKVTTPEDIDRYLKPKINMLKITRNGRIQIVLIE